MTDDADSKKLAASKILFGQKDPPEKPARVFQETMRFTPSGTTTARAPTPEGRVYLNELESRKAQAERAKLDLSNVPRAERTASGQERTFRREGPDSDKNRGKDNDKDNDLER